MQLLRTCTSVSSPYLLGSDGRCFEPPFQDAFHFFGNRKHDELVQGNAFVEPAELHRVPQAYAARGVGVRDGLDAEDDRAKALGEGRGQPRERSPGDRFDLVLGRPSQGQALGGGHALRPRGAVPERQGCRGQRACLHGRPSSAIL